MSLNKKQCEEIEGILKTSLRKKFQSYNPEPASMPFHTRLLGSDRLALYSFIHSLSTNFGTAIFEPVAIAIAKNKYKIAKAHTEVGDYIHEKSLFEIQKIIDSLTTATSMPNKVEEIKAIRKVCQDGIKRNVKLTLADIYIEDYDGNIYLFDLKTAKPNAGGFREFKRTLLEWVAAALAFNPGANVSTMIAIPYNPYEPQPYNRWTMRGMLDLNNELKVGSEFWDFLGGEGTYHDLLDCFERVGIEMRDEIDEYFDRYNKTKN
ncbi:MAG: TdeIII family type II restriction endonuclease [Dehalococcoidales bacterium]|nr:TdeIII family type II restriction endonuclease [Dehalococcoidales bacterium]